MRRDSFMHRQYIRIMWISYILAGLFAKEPRVSTKEPYILAEEPYISAKAPYFFPHEGGVRNFSKERGFSVYSSLQGISSNSLLWKRNDSSVVL